MATFEQHRTSTIRRRRELFEQVRGLLAEHLGDGDLGVDDIAGRVFASRRQIQRVMGEHGTTFRDELTALRMERAAELLLTTRLTVREVAARVGYRQPAQFAKAFRRHHGRGPSAFRQARGRPVLADAA